MILSCWSVFVWESAKLLSLTQHESTTRSQRSLEELTLQMDWKTVCKSTIQSFSCFFVCLFVLLHWLNTLTIDLILLHLHKIVLNICTRTIADRLLESECYGYIEWLSISVEAEWWVNAEPRGPGRKDSILMHHEGWRNLIAIMWQSLVTLLPFLHSSGCTRPIISPFTTAPRGLPLIINSPCCK